MRVLISMLMAALFAAGNAVAAEGNWLVRGRAVYLDMKTKSDATSGPLAGVLPADTIAISDEWIPEVDISYFFSRNWAAELILTYPQKHDVTINALGIGNIGNFKHLPPTLLLQYHFLPEGQFRPYAGVGINYTRFSSVNLVVPGVGALDLESSSFGPAIQAGLDIKLDGQWFLNFDIKKIQIRSDLYLAGAKVSTLKPDPLAMGVGLGYRF
jgi:outer membrane protein